MQFSHHQIASALCGYPCIETIDMSAVQYADGKWTYKNRELKMTLPPMSCFVRKLADKNILTLNLSVVPEYHQPMIDAFEILVAKAHETKAYDPTSRLILARDEKTTRQNIVLYVTEQRLRRMCSDNHLKYENVVGRTAIVTPQVAVNQHKTKDDSLPWFELTLHAITFTKVFKGPDSRNPEHDADAMLGLLPNVKDDDIKIVHIKTRPKSGKPQ